MGRQLLAWTANFLRRRRRLYYLFVASAAFCLLTETIATLVIMAGRRGISFGICLLVGDHFRETYRNVERLGPLTVASSMIAITLGLFGIFVFYLALIVASLAILLAVAAFSFFPLAAFLVSVAIGLAVMLGATWFFFLIASRLAFVPQVMLVEGQGVFASVGRSISLAGQCTEARALLFFLRSLLTRPLLCCMCRWPGTLRQTVFS